MMRSDDIPEKIDAKESDYLYVSASCIAAAGDGLFTSIKIYENEIISIYKGNVLSNEEAAARVKNKTDHYFINLLDGTIMDSLNVKGFAKYANDAEGLSKSPFENNAKISMDENGKVCLVAIRDIKIGEEIFCGYGKKYWRHFIKNRSISPT
jgi:SET domain-containing protein